MPPLLRPAKRPVKKKSIAAHPALDRGENRGGSPREKGRHTLRQWGIALGLLTGLTLAMFGHVLLRAGDVVLSNPTKDLSLQYLHWRAFGFGELQQGHLALWNPHLFSGAPFFGGFQSALLYPPNVLFLVLPLARAVNWSIALHVFLAGTFTYAWAARRQLAPPACFLAAVMVMFCGAHFLHIFAGHLTHLCTMVWAPLIFLAIDGSFEKPSLGWSLLGMFATAMQVLAGYPQYAFFTGVAAAVYCALCYFRASQRARFAFSVAGIVAGGVGLSAMQLFPGILESSELVRGPGLSYAAAATFSFPPANLLTLCLPDIFGDMKTVPYWGAWYLWEMSVYVGVCGLALGVAGAIWGEPRQRRFSVVMVVVLLLLALGRYTPLWKLCYYWVPGFDKFRGSSKFIFPASLFIAMLAGIGFNELLERRRPPGRFIWGAALAAILLLAGAVVAYQAGPGTTAGHWLQAAMAAAQTSEKPEGPDNYFKQESALAGAAKLASQSLLIAGATLASFAGLLWAARKHPWALWVLLALAVAELFAFARGSLDWFDIRKAVPPALKECVEKHPGDYRILDLSNPNAAMSLGANEIWGYDPGIMLRYAQLLAFSQGMNPDHAGLDVPFARDTPLLGMLRCRFAFVSQNNQTKILEQTNYLPRLLLVQQCRVLHERNDIFSALTDAAFDPRKEVILESSPQPQPAPHQDAGRVRLVDSSTDHLTVEAELPAPAILLVTDSYAKGWQARALPGSAQRAYEVMPANWCLRGVPLSAGHHLLRMVYRPAGFVVGKWLSLISLAVFGVLVGVWLKRARTA